MAKFPHRVRPGDPIEAANFNALVEKSERSVRGIGVQVLEDSTGWAVKGGQSEASSPVRLAKVICHGPQGQPSPTNENYWCQFVDKLPDVSPDDPGESPEFDTDANEIVLMTNTYEAQTHTHGVRVGSIVHAWQTKATDGTLRWVFTFSTMLMVSMFGGFFGCGGSRYVNGTALLHVNHWDQDVEPELQWNRESIGDGGQGMGVPRDLAWFNGTFWRAGEMTLPAGIDLVQYGLAYYDWDTHRWVGVAIRTDEFGGTGNALLPWAVPHVQEITISGSPDAGSFRLRRGAVGSYIYTADIQFNATADELAEAIRITIPGAKAGDVKCYREGTGTDFTWTIRLVNSLYGTDLDPLTCDDFTGLTRNGYHGTQAVGVSVIRSAGELRLYYAQIGGTGDPPVAQTEVVAIDFDPETKAITIDEIDWPAEIGAAIAFDIFPWDDRQGDGEKLYFPLVLKDLLDDQIVRWHPTGGYEALGEFNMPGSDGWIQGICAHDFGDGTGEMLCVGGRFDTVSPSAGDGSGYNNVAALHPVSLEWHKIGTGVSIVASTTSVYCLESYNDRLWCGSNESATPSLRLFFNSPLGLDSQWVSATSSVRGMISNESHPFYATSWTGYESVSAPAFPYSMRVHDDRLFIGTNSFHRVTRRGFIRTGPFVQFSPSEGPNGLYKRCLPTIRGEVYCLLPVPGGIAVGGDYVKSLPAGADPSEGGQLSSLAIWRDPGDPEIEGIWNNLKGGIVGKVYALAWFQGSLYALGNFSSAGGVPMKGFARWDGANWHYVANVSDYGTGYALCVLDGKLYIGGDFSAIDGQAQYKIIARWNGDSLQTVFDDIDSMDGFPIVRALYAHDGWLYIGGFFDTIDGLTTETCHSIARWQPSTDTIESLFDDDDTSEGLQSDAQVYSISAFDPTGGGVWIYVGTSAKSLAGSATAGQESSIWRWNPGASANEWSNGLSVVWGESAVRAMAATSDFSALYVGVEARSTFGLEFLGVKFRVAKLQSGSSTVFLGALDGIFENEVQAVAYGNAGAGPKLFAGGPIDAVGTLTSAAPRMANLVTSINRKDRIVDVAGGLGYTGYQAQVFAASETCSRMRVIGLPDQACNHLACIGNFLLANDFYCQYMIGIDLKGRLRDLGGYLTGSRRSDQPGAADGVYDAKAIPRDEWPAYWEPLIGPCDPKSNFVWGFCGSFSTAIMENIADDDVGKVPEATGIPGMGLYIPGEFKSGNPVGFLAFAQTFECYQRKLIMAGGLTDSPWWWDGDMAGGDWVELYDPAATGNPQGSTNFLMRFHGLLWQAGRYFIAPDLDAADGTVSMVRWDGATPNIVEPVGFTRIADGPGIPASVCELWGYAVGKMGDLDQLYAFGFPNPDECPVIVRTGTIGAAGTWAAVGGSSQLRGTCYGLTCVEYPDGPRLVACGVLSVNVASVWTDCTIAVFDGSTWAVGGFIDGVATVTAVISESRSFASCEKNRMTAIVAGEMGQIAPAAGDLDSTTATKAYGMAEWHRDDGFLTYRYGRGVNGVCLRSGTAVRILFPKIGQQD